MNVCSDTLFLLLSIMCCFGSNVNNLKNSKQKSKNDYTNVLADAARIYSSTDVYSQPLRFDPSSSEVCNEDIACMILSTSDRMGLEAIKSLHRQLDDDANGAVDLSESDDFLREELQYESGAERRQKAFHHNDDMHISVKELWEAWVRSEVHNWTVEQTTEWLARNVALPQYVPIFILNGVTGATLPRLAVNNMQYLNNVLGIKDPIHKQKIALKAMDVVLFGPPKETSHYIKDIILISLLLSALVGCWLAYRINKRDRRHLKRMMKDMESLHKAELTLKNLQKELEQARIEQESAATEKQNLEKKLLEQSTDVSELKSSFSDLEVSQLKAEIEMLRNELQRAEGELEDRCWSPPVGLQQWLQLTHEIENKSYLKKKVSAEKQLQSAREACEKLRKKRSSLVGAFVSTHGKSIDEVDRSIVEARTALNEVTHELAERVHRWKQIEMLCGFNIINNSGLTVLESVLYKSTPNGRGIGLKGRISSHDDLDDESSVCLSEHGLDVAASVGGCADSSESEKMDCDEDEAASTNVDFTLGGSEEDDLSMKIRSVLLKGSSEQLNRSLSQETTDFFEQESIGSNKCIIESSSSDIPSMHGLSSRQKKCTSSHSKSEAISLDDEAYSTDSNSTATDDIGTFDKVSKRNKLRFPKFARKSKPHTSDKYT